MRKKLLIISILIFGCAAVNYGQKTQSKKDEAKPSVVVKTDEFTGNKTISLAKLRLAPELEMDAECIIKSAQTSRFEEDMRYATLTFLHTGKTPLRQGNLEVNFMVDGKIVKGGPANVRIIPNAEQIIAVADISNLLKIGSGKKVTMKIGDVLFKIAPNSVELIGEFAEAVK